MNRSYQSRASTNVSETAVARATIMMVVDSCIFVLIDIAALVGNSLVCLAFYRNPSLRTITNYFIFSLALTDFSMAISAIPLDAASSIANARIGGNAFCKLHHLVGHILGGTSLLTIMLMALNRYLRVARPELYASIYSKTRSLVMALCAWVATAVANTALFFITRLQFRTYSVQPLCFRVFPSTAASALYSAITSLYIVIPSSVIVVCYVKIYRTIRRHNTEAVPSSQGGHSRYGVEERKVTRMLTVVVVGFYFCWLPVLVTRILFAVSVIGESSIKYLTFYLVFPVYCSSVINPTIYAIMSRAFRKEFLKIIRRRH